jgi:hypothetical protein
VREGVTVRRSILVLAALAALLMLVAGCGGDDGGGALSKEEYSTQVGEIGDTLQAAFADIAKKAESISAADVGSLSEAGDLLDELAVVVEDGAAALQDAADELDAITPPDDAADANQGLAAGLSALSQQFTDLQAALEGGSFAEIAELAKGIQEIATSEAGTQVSDAIESLKAKGYDVEGETP